MDNFYFLALNHLSFSDWPEQQLFYKSPAEPRKLWNEVLRFGCHIPVQPDRIQFLLSQLSEPVNPAVCPSKFFGFSAGVFGRKAIEVPI